MLAASSEAQPVSAIPLALIDVPYISQSEALCGGAAAAMVLRFWGERGLTAESFAHLVDRSAAGIATTALTAELRGRGWNATGIAGTAALLEQELARGRPVMALVQDRPGTFHYVVVVGATATAVIVHDPARVPYRTMGRREFEDRWAAAERWMAVVTPKGQGERQEATGERLEARADGESCEGRVAAAVTAARGNDLAAAERRLLDSLSCSGATRELAGVRLLQQRWPDVVSLASVATAEDARDTQAWRLLATGLFVQNDPTRALAAWNRAGEPRVDRLSVLGLERTRHRVVERYVGLQPGALLTPASAVRAARRLEALPSMLSTRLDYVPQSGLADVRAYVVERPPAPGGVWAWAGIGARAAARREVAVAFGSPTGGGERIDASWRFWPGRPRHALAIEAPAPWGGLWSASGVVERQPFDQQLQPARRSSATLALSTWATPRLQLGVRGGVDRWRDRGAFAAVGGDARVYSLDERLDVRADAWLAAGSGSFSTVSFDVTARSAGTRVAAVEPTAPRARRVLIARAGMAAASARAPEDVWFGGDTGHARDVRLRAHPLLDDGRLTLDRLGRRIVHVSGEAQQWWPVAAGVRVGAALFADAARVSARWRPGTAGDVDVGAGARVALPGVSGHFRLDVAKGLRDGATAVSFVYEAR